MSTFLLLSGGYFRRLCTGPKYYAQTPARIAVRAITLVCDCAGHTLSPSVADSLRMIAGRGPRTQPVKTVAMTTAKTAVSTPAKTPPGHRKPGHPNGRSVQRRGGACSELNGGISVLQPLPSVSPLSSAPRPIQSRVPKPPRAHP